MSLLLLPLIVSWNVLNLGRERRRIGGDGTPRGRQACSPGTRPRLPKAKLEAGLYFGAGIPAVHIHPFAGQTPAESSPFRHARLRAYALPGRDPVAWCSDPRAEIRASALLEKVAGRRCTGSGSYEDDGRAGTAPRTLGAVLRSAAGW
jgi:hypothetical protein